MAEKPAGISHNKVQIDMKTLSKCVSDDDHSHLYLDFTNT